MMRYTIPIFSGVVQGQMLPLFLLTRKNLIMLRERGFLELNDEPWSNLTSKSTEQHTQGSSQRFLVH
uniref:Uncharacterized protein n=1 Tax=Rhizophora mucronata TaxID=61149 RepID=A0A2P2KFN2_RHIMU